MPVRMKRKTLLTSSEKPNHILDFKPISMMKPAHITTSPTAARLIVMREVSFLRFAKAKPVRPAPSAIHIKFIIIKISIFLSITDLMF